MRLALFVVVMLTGCRHTEVSHRRVETLPPDAPHVECRWQGAERPAHLDAAPRWSHDVGLRSGESVTLGALELSVVDAFLPMGGPYGYDVGSWHPHLRATDCSTRPCLLEPSWLHEARPSEWVLGVGDHRLTILERSGARARLRVERVWCADQEKVALPNAGQAVALWLASHRGPRFVSVVDGTTEVGQLHFRGDQLHVWTPYGDEHLRTGSIQLGALSVTLEETTPAALKLRLERRAP